MKIVFFGTPDFAAHILEHLVSQGLHEIVGVVSKPDKPRGRDLRLLPTPVKEVASSLLPEVPLFQPRRISTEEMASQLKELNPDLFIVVAYGEIIRPMILSIPKFGCINIHASLLPKYRGAAPMQRALMDGVHETGVTIMRMDEGMDTGDILVTKAFPVPEAMNMQELSQEMLHASKEALNEALCRIDAGRAVYTAQHHEKATYAPKITPEDLILHPEDSSSRSLHNRVRALSPRPGAFLLVQIKGAAKRLKVLKTALYPRDSSSCSGQSIEKMRLCASEHGLKLCMPHDSDFDLILTRVQLEGKREMSGEEFMRGIDIKEIALS